MLLLRAMRSALRRGRQRLLARFATLGVQLLEVLDLIALLVQKYKYCTDSRRAAAEDANGRADESGGGTREAEELAKRLVLAQKQLAAALEREREAVGEARVAKAARERFLLLSLLALLVQKYKF